MRLFQRAQPPVDACTPTLMRQLVKGVLAYVGVDAGDDGDGTDLAIVTSGETFPTSADGRAERVHYLRDPQGHVVAVQYYASGKVYDFDRRIIGEVRHLPVGTNGVGWRLADGTDGTYNLKDDAPSFFSPLPNGLLLAYQYLGSS